MCRRLLILVMLLATVSLYSDSASAEVYELRTYTTHEGKLGNLHARFRDHTIKLFDKHGMKSVGYWVPTDETLSKNTLIYVLEHASRDAAKASWKAFVADTDWQAAYKASTADGKLLSKAPEAVFMEKTDYSPEFTAGAAGADVVYELRTYRAGEGKLKPLDARFRDHTIGLFDRHEIQSVAYWYQTKPVDEHGALIYLVRHASRDGAKTAWKGFSSDPDWKKVATESKEKDGRLLRERPSSVYMKPTDYSALK